MQIQSADFGVRPARGLIGSDKVEGTPVYSSDGEGLGTIDSLMIDKLSGKVAYAVMSTSGTIQYPVPWSLLTFNTGLGGYEVNISVVQLQGAPKLGDCASWDDANREEEDQLYRYYNTPPYWA